MQFDTSDAIRCWNECAELRQRERKWRKGLNPDASGLERLTRERAEKYEILVANGMGILVMIAFRDASGCHEYAAFVAHENGVYSPPQSLRVFFSYRARAVSESMRELCDDTRDMLLTSPPLDAINAHIRAACEDVVVRFDSLRCVVADVSELRTDYMCFLFRPPVYFGISAPLEAMIRDGKRTELLVLPTQADAENLVDNLRNAIAAEGMPRNMVPFEIVGVRQARAPLFWPTNASDQTEIRHLRRQFVSWASILRLKQEEEDRVLGPRQP